MKVIPLSNQFPSPVMVFHLNITETKFTEIEHHTLSDLVEQSGDSIIYTDKEFRIQYINRAAEKLLGWSLGEVRGKKPDFLNAERNSDELQSNIYSTVSSGNTFFGVALNRKKDNSTFYCQFRITPLFDSMGEVYGYMGLQRDTSEVEQAKEALQESEDRYRSFIKNFHGIAYRGNMDFSAVFIHGAVEEITGYTEENLTSGTPKWNQLVYPEDLARIYEDEKILKSVPNYSKEREYRIVRKGGKVRWIREFVQNICNEEGKPSYIQGTIYDITERKEDKEKIKHLNSVLQAFRSVNRLIIKEKDRDRLLQRICDKIIETRSFYNTQIVLFGDNREISRVYRAGWKNEFQRIEKEKAREELSEAERFTDRIRNVLNLSQVAVTGEAYRCYDFCFSSYNGEEKSFSARLEYSGKIYGVISTQIYGDFVSKEDVRPLLQEVADDIAFALYNIETEEKRAQAEKELKESYERFSKIFESAPALISLSSIEDGTYFDVNEKFLTVSGFSREEVIGKKSVELGWLSKEDRTRIIQTIREEGKVGGLELVLHRKDGKKITCLYYGELITINGKQQLLSLAKNITERTQIENNLRESEERYRVLLEYSPMALLVLRGGKYLYVNPEGCRILGYSSPEEVKKLNAFDVFLPEDREIIMERMKNVAEGKKNKTEKLRIQRKDGSLIYTESISIPITFDGETAAFIVGKDITEHKRAEEEMRQLTQRLKLATESARIGVWEIGIDGNLLFWDERMYDLYGLKSEEVEVTYDTWQKRVHPDDLPKISKEVWNAIKNKQGFHTEFKITKPDGEVHNIEAYGIILESSKDTPAKMIGVNMDITERKRGEEALLMAKLAAEKANRTKDEFLANVSHELRTPLNSIIGYSSLLQEIEKENLSEKQERYIENILKSGKHLLRIINDILDISKIEVGKMELFYCCFQVSNAINDIVNLILPMATEKRIDIGVQIKPQSLKIFADMTRFKQIMYNLLSNAVKFTPDGGHVFVLAELLKNNLQVSVSDTGIGIPRESQKVLFEPFKQVDPFITRKYSGTGLGLALVKELVNLHGGSIRVESEVEKGSTFTFHIPVKRDIRT